MVFVGLFLLVLLAICSTAFTENILNLRFVILLTVPLFAVLYFLKSRAPSPLMGFFLLFAFLGNAFSIIFSEAKYVGVSNILYLAASVCLLINVQPKFKRSMQNKNSWLVSYLLGMFVIGLCFLFEITHVFSLLVLKDIEFYVFVFQGIGLLLLVFMSFGVYLNTQSPSAISFLVASISFGFALAVSYISAFYLYDWAFVQLSSLFYLSGLYFMFKYLLMENKKKTKITKRIEECEVLYSEIVYA